MNSTMTKNTRMKNKESVAKALKELLGEECVLVDEPLKPHTSFRVGGPADFYLLPEHVEDLKNTLSFLKNEEIPFFIMGNGSNLLVSDDGFRGAVIRFGKNMESVRLDGLTIRAEAGASLAFVARTAAKAELTGMEFAGGIPGSVGGACVMNAGAYGGEMKQVLKNVRCLNEHFEEEVVSGEDLQLGYRTSVFSKRTLIALEAEMELRPGKGEDINAMMEDFRQRRQEKQPLDLPSAGSTFKRPEGYFAGKLIMDAGLRGYRVGGASVSEKHCGFVVNDQGATAADICTLISDVRKIVLEQSGILLEPEVRFLGF